MCVCVWGGGGGGGDFENYARNKASPAELLLQGNLA